MHIPGQGEALLHASIFRCRRDVDSCAGDPQARVARELHDHAKAERVIEEIGTPTTIPGRS